MTSSTARHAVATAVLLCTAALATGCGSATPNSPTVPASLSASGSGTAGGGGSSGPTSAASPGTAVSPCASSDLKAVVDIAQSSGAAGSVYYPIDFTNSSSGQCSLYGYPGVSFVTGNRGTQLGRAASRDTAAGPTAVTLAPGQTAHATLRVAEAGNFDASQCQPVTAHWLKVYPPNQFTPLYVPFTTQACSARLPSDVGSQLSVFVVASGPGKAGQAP
jgi:Domain of unknown function (DUF4232)